MRTCSRFAPALLFCLACGATESPGRAPTPRAATPLRALGPEGASPAASEGAVPDEVAPGDRARIAALSVEAEAVFGAFGNGAPRLSRDGARVVFRSNRDGMPRLYVADAKDPRGPARLLVGGAERIVSATLMPDSDTVVYASDRGADENFSMFAVSLDGTSPRELTPSEAMQRDTPIAARRVPGVVYFSARPHAESKTRVYSVKVDGSAKPTLLYTDPGVGSLAAVSPDGKRALLRRHQTLSSQKLVFVDLEKGEGRVAYPTQNDASVSEAVFLSDGKQCLVGTDGGSEANLLLKIDCASGKEVARFVDVKARTGAIAGARLSHDGKTVALAFDAGNHGVIRLVDVASMKALRDAELPFGDGNVGDFTPDDRGLVVSWATPESPTDIVGIDVRTGKRSFVRQEARPGLAGLVPLDVNIATVDAHDGLAIPVNTYVPRGAPSKLPVMVMVHGGPADSSSVSYSPLVRFYTAHGFAVVEPNVRGSTGFGRAFEEADNGPKRLDALKDLEAVARWSGAQSWGDASRLVVWGGSYGGYMTLMAMTRQSELWRAGVDLVGPSNWRSFMKTTTGSIREILSKEFGSVETDGAFLDSISPLGDIEKVKRPLFVFQGKNDPRVPQAESDQIVSLLRTRKVPVEYMVAADEGHSLDRRPNQVAFAARTTLFLHTHLGMR